MATTGPPASHASQQATGPKDPFGVVEAMFNGSVTRIAYAIRDPKQFGDSTPIVLAACAKRYQDALDDCEIKILDAKWYLEQKLKENKARREAATKAKESSSAPTTKRKREEAEDVVEVQELETPTKRIKAEKVASPNSAAAEAQTKLTASPQQPDKVDSTAQEPVATPIVNASAKQDQKPSEDLKEETEPTPQPAVQDRQQPQQFETDDFTRPTPAETPTGTNNDEDLFESMFGEPNEQSNPLDPDNDTEFNFMNDNFDQSQTQTRDKTAQDTADTNPNTQTQLQSQSQTQPPTQASTQTQAQPQSQSQPQSQNQPQATSNDRSSLSSILPGLEQYANQSDDISNNNIDNDTAQIDALDDVAQDATAANLFTTEFEPNIFDSYLDDAEFNVTGGDDGASNDFGMNVGNPSDSNFDFDDLFGNGD